MSERRRSLFILLIVVALIGGSIVVVLTKPTKLGLDLQGGVQLVYQAKPTAQQPRRRRGDAAVDRPDAAARERVRRLRGRGLPVRRRPDRGQPPGRRGRRGAAEQVGSTAQLFFYDWEANILDEKCKTDPDHERERTASRSSGSARRSTQASKCTSVGVGRGLDPLADDSPGGESQAAAEPRFYVFDKATKKPLGDGSRRSTRARTRWTSLHRRGARRTPRSSRSRPACSSCARERADADDPNPDRWWVIQDRPGLSGTDIKQPGAELRPERRQRADRHVQLHRQGPRGVPGDHAPGRPARRRQRARPGRRSRPRSTSRSRSTTSSSRRRTSTGRRTRTASTARPAPQISGSFTIQSAQDLAKILKIGALPLKLTEVSRSQVSATLGQQALDQGLKAGIAGFVIVALFLIIYYRVLGVIATVALCIYALYFYALVKLIPITLTLPGIAGLILTLGVAADANIVVFERVKEEVRAGRSIGDRDHHGLPQGPDGDHRREHRHVPRRVHPLHHRHRGRPGLRLHARPRRHRLAVHGGARDAGDPVLAARARA